MGEWELKGSTIGPIDLYRKGWEGSRKDHQWGLCLQKGIGRELKGSPMDPMSARKDGEGAERITSGSYVCRKGFGGGS